MSLVCLRFRLSRWEKFTKRISEADIILLNAE
jgi:hypothetical protein